MPPRTKKKPRETPDGMMKGLPQHIKAAMLLGKDLQAGDIIRYVKTKDDIGVKPAEQADPKDIDVEKYFEAMKSAFQPILEPLGMDFDSILGKPKQMRLDAVWG